MEEQGCWLKTAVEDQTLTIRAGGEWTVERAGELDELVGGLRMDGVQTVRLDVWTLKKGEEHKPQRLRKKAN